MTRASRRAPLRRRSRQQGRLVVRRERFLERVGDQVLSLEDRYGNDRRRDAPPVPTCVCVVKA